MWCHHQKKIIAVVITILLIILSGCKSAEPSPSVPGLPDLEESQKNNPSQKDIDYAQGERNRAEEQKQEDITAQIDYQKVKPNELGEVMIVMYHYFGEEEKDTWWRSFENFRKDLKILYEKGYRLISLDDFLSNNIDIPAGTSPVVFTFDDGTNGQFKLIEKNGHKVVSPDTAVGIMQEFYNNHPDFGLEGTFYINDEAFVGSAGTEKERLQYLLDLGMDIGNHTFGHTNLAKADPQAIQEAIGKHVEKMNNYFPNYKHSTLALPFGEYANSTFNYIVEGQYNNIKYKNDAVLLVGWKPSPSSVHRNFDPLKLLRVRAGEGVEHDMYYYLDYFDKNPEMRYVSDGDKDTICFPEELSENLRPEKVGDKKIITY